MKEKSYVIKAVIQNVEVRKVEVESFEIKEKTYKRLCLSCDDIDGDRIFLIDKDISNLEKYKRGMICDFYINIECVEGYKKKSTKIYVTDFKEKE